MAGDATKQKGRLVTIDTPLGEDALLVTDFHATERLSRPFLVTLELVADVKAGASPVRAKQILGKPVTVKVATGEDFENGPFRTFHGIVNEFSLEGQDERFTYYEMVLVPWLSLLDKRANCRVFQNMTIRDVIKKVFDEAKSDFSFVKYDDKLTGNYTSVDYCIQYRETDFNFVTRLMEGEGICFHFDHAKDGHTLVLTDSADSQQPCPIQNGFRYLPDGGTDESDRDVILSWERENELRTGKYKYRDFNFQMPGKTLEVSDKSKETVGGNDKLEVYDYPAEYAHRFNAPDERLSQVETEGQNMIRWRMEDVEIPHDQVAGISNCRTMLPGYTFDLSKHFDSAQNGSYVLTSVQHSASQGSQFVSGEDFESGNSYQNSFTCLPGKTVYRPSRLARKPIMHGLQTAMVVGPKGEEIHTDKYGRVKVQFHWDREGKKDDKSSCWLRVSQGWAGQQWGMHFWPRIGHEVLVAFLEGDPDQPIIVGSVYNAENMPPYQMPDNQTRSGIKSRSTKEGSSDNFNELRFEDKKDEEEIYLHAERDLNAVIENNETRKVGFDKQGKGDQTVEIFNDQFVKVGWGKEEAATGDQAVGIWNDQYLTVGYGEGQNAAGDQVVGIWRHRDVKIKTGNDSLVIEKGNREVEITMGNETTNVNLGKSTKEAMQSIELKVGSSSIKIDQTGVTIEGMNIKIDGKVMTDVKGGAMAKFEGTGMAVVKGGAVMIN